MTCDKYAWGAGKTCLHYAVHEGYNKVVMLLLQHNPDVTIKDHEVWSNSVS